MAGRAASSWSMGVVMVPFLWVSAGVNRGSSGRIQARFRGHIKAIPAGFSGRGGDGQDAAAEAEQAGGEELGNVSPAVVRSLVSGVPRHMALPSAPSRCGAVEETYA